MSLTGAYEPSTWDAAREQVELFERSGGAEGNTLDGFPVIILTMLARAGVLPWRTSTASPKPH